MPTYTIKAPDGNTYSVEGPDNASQEQVQQEVARQHPEALGSSQTGDKTTSAAGVQGTQLSNGSVSQATPADQLDPTSGMSTTDKMVAGMGQAYSNLGTGVKQRFQQMTGQDAAYKQSQAEVDQQRVLDKQLEATNAGKAGNLLGQLTMMASMPGGGLAAAAAAGAVSGATAATGAGESAAQNAAFGGMLGAVGSGIGKLLGKVVGGIVQLPGKSELSAAAEEGIEVLRANGVPMNAAQQGGGKAATTLTNIAGDSPWTGSTLAIEQKKAFTSAVMSQLGITSETADKVTMAQAKLGIGNKFDTMAAKYPIPMQGALLDKLATIETAASSELDAGQMSIIQKQIDNLVNKAADTGTLSGKAFQNARSSLSRLQAEQNVTGHWAGEVHDALTEALGTQATKEDQTTITQMRTQWKALRQVQDAIGKDDLIAPAALYGVLDRVGNRNQMVYGAGDQSLVQLAQAGANILGNHTANSGTTQRAIGMLSMGASLGAIDQLVHGDPKEALSVGLLGVAGPNLAKLVTENPASARIIGQWARSKVIANFRVNAVKQGAKLMGMAGGAAAQNGSGQMQGTPYNGVDTNPGGEETTE